MTRKFTGWHMATAMVAFFGVVIAVNTIMALQASRTFGGTVVDNSYVASQKFNHWLDQAKAQQAQGWRLAARTQDGRAVLTASAHGAPLTPTRISVYAEHPLGQLDDIRLEFHATAPGSYVADKRLPAGRWRLHVRLIQGTRHADFLEDVYA